MKYRKHILLFLLITAFTFNVTASVAMAACNCLHGEIEATTDMTAMPCHGLEVATVDQTDNAEKQTSQCTECECGDCSITSQLFFNQITSSAPVLTDAITIAYFDAITPLVVYGIDNPPKQTS